MLHPPPPPYAVVPAWFRFPALAALAGRLPLGAGREATLSALLAARLAAGLAPPDQLDAGVRTTRSAAARQWLPSLCPDSRVRAACTALVAASAEGDPVAAGRAVDRVIDVTAAYLDTGARSELLALAKSLTEAGSG